MQFSVIVEGSIDQSLASEDSLAELERFLLAAKISPQIVQQLKNGQSHLIKKELSYEEAVKICDRLMDFGVESIIDPPIKPDEKPKPVPMKSQVSPITGSQARKDSAQKEKPQLSPANQAAPRPNNVRPIRKDSTLTSTEKSRQTKTAGNPEEINRAAARVKALFKLPKGGLNPISLDTASLTRLKLQAGLSLLLLCLQPFMVAALAVTTLFLTYSIFQIISNVSIFLAGLIAIIPFVIFGYITFVLSTSLWKNKKHTLIQQPVTAKEQTQLFMLTNAICKLLAIPAPKTIYFDLPPTKYSYNTIRLQSHHTIKEFFRLNKPLNSDSALSVSANLVNSLSVRRYCGLVARECGRYSAPQARRATLIQLTALRWLENANLRVQVISDYLISLKVSSEKLQHAVSQIAQVTQRIEAINQGYLTFCEQLVRKQLDGNSSPFTSYQTSIIGDETIGNTSSQLADVDQAYFDCITTLLEENEKPTLVDNLPALTAHFLPKPLAGKQTEHKTMPTESVIVGNVVLREVMIDFDKICMSLTSRLYKQMGYTTEPQNYLSVKSYFSSKDKQKKLESLGAEFFGKWFHEKLLWRVPALNTLSNANTESLIKKLNRCIERVRYQTPDRSATLEKFARLSPLLSELSAARKLAMSGINFKPHGASAPGKTIDEQLKKIQIEFKDLNTELGQHNALMGERITLGLMLDIEHQPSCQKIYFSLATLAECGSKNLQLQLDCHELETLVAHKPKKITQHYTLQNKELTERIEDSCKQIVRRLKHCPFDMCDARYATLADMIDSKSETSAESSNSFRVLVRAKNILAVVAEGHAALSQLSAGYATRVEKLYGIESIRKAK